MAERSVKQSASRIAEKPAMKKRVSFDAEWVVFHILYHGSIMYRADLFPELPEQSLVHLRRNPFCH